MLREFVIVSFCVIGAFSAEFEDAFRSCYPDVSGFDACIREGLNAVRPYFKTGLSKYNIAPFDPFFAKETTVKRGLPNFGFSLTLRNITESGWTASKVTKFVSDLPNYKVVYTQSFPAKFLNGDYEFRGNILGPRMINNGKFTLDLYDLVQTTTVTKQPGSKLTVRVEVQTIRDLKLHITNLVQGRSFIENIVDRVINGVWQPGFVMSRGIINDLVSNAFTEIFGRAFSDFPFDKIVRKKSVKTS
ncbi:uncharacterized protein LOC107035951 [Diachasma alloeum]|uniref:uncharacterized protein LOC107035951 n=1 Tax=Diachasma alloeum TaxID=454923 RepID=UPI0007384991|nr:uncharacterized protein LOC107035951 [Diachasma alloeum]